MQLGTIKRETLRELAEEAGAEFIRREGQYAVVRWPGGLAVKLDRVQLLVARDDLATARWGSSR